MLGLPRREPRDLFHSAETGRDADHVSEIDVAIAAFGE
jgi:hypothetical protein